MLHTSTTVLKSMKYLVIWYNFKIILILERYYSLHYLSWRFLLLVTSNKTSVLVGMFDAGFLPYLLWEFLFPVMYVTTIISYHIISFISVDPYRIRNPYGYGKWSHNHRVYKTIKTIFVSLTPYKLFDILRQSQYLINNICISSAL